MESELLEETLGLTPREAEVLTLVARGYTNREIADALVISVKTASVHVCTSCASSPRPETGAKPPQSRTALRLPPGDGPAELDA